MSLFCSNAFQYRQFGPAGNDPALTNVPQIRLKFRQEALLGELDFILRNAKRHKGFKANDSAYLDKLRVYYGGEKQ